MHKSIFILLYVKVRICFIFLYTRILFMMLPTIFIWKKWIYFIFMYNTILFPVFICLKYKNHITWVVKKFMEYWYTGDVWKVKNKKWISAGFLLSACKNLITTYNSVFVQFHGANYLCFDLTMMMLNIKTVLAVTKSITYFLLLCITIFTMF